ncbi:mitogen-activated protein kinase kinase kinase ANP1 [Biomphalaria glabrata]|nr:mitogen-activated protein kinase kinase kinase ANP1-like [Biomphalaria glabrata]
MSGVVQILDIKDDFFQTFKFKPGHTIGSGLSGNVVLATHLDNPNIKRAVKMFSSCNEEDAIKGKKLFVREVKMMQSVDHPNIMKAIVAVRCPMYLAICMPFYQKGSLSSLLHELTPSHLAVYFAQLTCVLSFLDNKRIVHADIKPSNILVDDQQNVILGDFGLAFSVPHGTEVISSDKVGGTPAFMAPELHTLGNVDPFKLDVYSLGATLWCILFQKEPKSTLTFDYLFEINKSPDIPQPYRWALTKMFDPVANKRLHINHLLAKLRKIRFCPTIIDHLTKADHSR